MRSSTKGALAAAAFAFLIGSASGQAWSDNFDGYAAGTDIPTSSGPNGPNEWEIWGGAAGIALNLVVDNTTQAPQAGANSLFVTPGTDLVADWAHQGNGPPNSGDWRFQAYVFQPTSSTGEQFWIMLNTYQPGAAIQFGWSVQVAMNPSTGIVECDCGASNNGTTPIVQNQWVELFAEIDLNNDLVQVWYDGVDLFPGGYSWTGQVFGGGAGNLEIQALDVYPAAATTDEIFWDSIQLFPDVGAIGTNYCGPAIPNSTGNSATMSADGSTFVAQNNVVLTMSDGTADFGYFLNSQSTGFFNPPNSNGFLCLSGSIGRHNQPGLAQPGPSFSITLDLTALPQPTLFYVVQAGETWNFTAWYRDTGSSNFADGIAILFQ